MFWPSELRDHRLMHARRLLGHRLAVRRRTDNLGLVHAPRPVEPGDLLALADGPALRVTVLVPLGSGGAVEALAEVETVTLTRRPA
jgi:hypothetical protein